MTEVAPPAEPVAPQPEVIKEGWLYREESVQGSLSTWKKRWNVLTLLKLECFKNTTENVPIASLPVASVEEMAYGANIGDKTWCFSLNTPRGLVKLAAMDEKERESWVSTFRALVPRAKVEIAKEMLLRKAKRKANLELAQQQIKEAIESILRDSARVGVLDGFKDYADSLAITFQALLKSTDLVTNMGLHSARQCAYVVSSIVDAANSTAAVCTNRAIQDEIVIRTRDIAVDTAALLGHATNAGNDKKAQVRMYETLEDIQEQVKEILDVLSASGSLQQEMDDAKADIELALENSFHGAPGEVVEVDVEKEIAQLNDRAKLMSTTIHNISNNACITPEQVGKYSQEVSTLMCELLGGTSVVAKSCGVDYSNPEYLAGTLDIHPRKKQQIEGLLSAAKGFAAATTNMIDLLKEVPRQEDDENIQFRLSMATRSADSALNAFSCATDTVESSVSSGFDYGITDFDYDGGDYDGPKVDGEDELLAALSAIESTVAEFSVIDISSVNPELTKVVNTADYGEPGTPAEASIIDAARMMGDTAVTFMGCAAEAQSALKRDDPNIYRKDPEWTANMVESAQGVRDTTTQLYDVSCNPSSDAQDIVAASRCVNQATATLVAYTRAKGDTSAPEQEKLVVAARSMAQAANFVAETAKRVQEEGNRNEEDAANAELRRLQNESASAQIKKEFEAQSDIAKLEAELEEARQYLVKLRRAIHGTTP